MSEVTGKQLEDMEALFVQTAANLTSDGGTITLHGLSPSTLYFSDRPQREVGHMSSRQFVDVWGDGDNSFAVNPPNAVLSFVEPGDRQPEDAVVVIQEPHLDGEALTYVLNSSTAPCLRPLDHVLCSSTRLVVRCHRFPPPGCIGGSDAGTAKTAEGDRACNPTCPLRPVMSPFWFVMYPERAGVLPSHFAGPFQSR